MDINPYAAPAEVNQRMDQSPDGSWLRVDGDCVVVGRYATFPARRIVTGEPTGPSDRRKRMLTWNRPFRLVIRRHQCTVSFCETKGVRRKRLLIRATITILPILVVSLLYGFNAIVMTPFAISWILFPRDGLKLVRVVAGRYWVRGASDEFLSYCREEFGTLDSDFD